jgi:hypothetical protein
MSFHSIVVPLNLRKPQSSKLRIMKRFYLQETSRVELRQVQKLRILDYDEIGIITQTVEDLADTSTEIGGYRIELTQVQQSRVQG